MVHGHSVGHRERAVEGRKSRAERATCQSTRVFRDPEWSLEASGFADVWKRGHFGWEYKAKEKDLEAAYRHLLDYRGAPD